MELMFHSLDSNDNKVFFRASYEIKNNTYVFQDKTDKGTTIYLTINDNEILFERKGNTNMQLLLSDNTLTGGHYENNVGLKFDFGVKTTSIKIESKKLEMEYSLFLDGNILSTHKIWVLFN